MHDLWSEGHAAICLRDGDAVFAAGAMPGYPGMHLRMVLTNRSVSAIGLLLLMPADSYIEQHDKI